MKRRRGRLGVVAVLLLAAATPTAFAAASSLYLRQIVLRSRAEADRVRAELERGQPFERLAREHSIDSSAERGGYLGLVPLDRLNDSFRRAAASLEPGQASEPFQSGQDWVLLYRMKRDFLERATRLLERGDELLEQKRLEEARDAYRAAVFLYPDFPRGHFALGVAYGMLEEPEREVESYRRALRLAPDFAQAHYNLGQVQASGGDPYGAMQAFQRAVAAKPDYAEAFVNLAALQLAAGDREAALASAGRAVEINPLLARAHYNLGLVQASGDLKAALRSFRLAATLSPSLLESRVNAAVALARLGRMEEARGELQELLEEHAGYQPARELLRQLEEMKPAPDAPEKPSRPEPGAAAEAHAAAARHWAQGRLESARREWQRALQSDPDYLPALLGLARAAVRAGAFAAAEELLERAEGGRPGSPEVALTRSELAYERRDFHTAYGLLRGLDPGRLEVPQVLRMIGLLLDLELHGRALEIAQEAVPPGEPTLWLSRLLAESGLHGEAKKVLEGNDTVEGSLERAHVLLRQLRFEESEPLLEQVLAAGHRPWQARMLLGKLYLDSGRAEKAVPVLEEAVQLQPNNVSGLHQLALACWQAGQLEAAVAWLRRGLEIEPQSDRLRYELGRMLAQGGEHVEALDLLLSVVARQPDHPRAHYALGDLYRRLGNPEASRRHLERFAELQESLERDRRDLKSRKEALREWAEKRP